MLLKMIKLLLNLQKIQVEKIKPRKKKKQQICEPILNSNYYHRLFNEMLNKMVSISFHTEPL